MGLYYPEITPVDESSASVESTARLVAGGAPISRAFAWVLVGRFSAAPTRLIVLPNMALSIALIRPRRRDSGREVTGGSTFPLRYETFS